MRHLTQDDRDDIEYALNEKMNFTEIADILGYHRTTIASEIKNRRIAGSANLYGTNFVRCEFESNCNNFEGIGCKRKCSKYVLRRCHILDKPPYVCNGCSKKQDVDIKSTFIELKMHKKTMKIY